VNRRLLPAGGRRSGPGGTPVSSYPQPQKENYAALGVPLALFPMTDQQFVSNNSAWPMKQNQEPHAHARALIKILFHAAVLYFVLRWRRRSFRKSGTQ
jgi:hypothetical protein